MRLFLQTIYLQNLVANGCYRLRYVRYVFHPGDRCGTCRLYEAQMMRYVPYPGAATLAWCHMERVPNLHGQEGPLSDMAVRARRTTD
jgi:hypothetical protein